MKLSISTQSLQDSIISKINKDHEEFLLFVDRVEDPRIIEFLERYITWKQDPRKSMMIYTMFGKVISEFDICIFANLHSFAANCFLDDSYWTVKWYKNKFADKQFDGVIQVPCDKDNMFAFPVVEWDADNGTQDPTVILEAMDQYVKNEAARSEYFDGLLTKFKKDND